MLTQDNELRVMGDYLVPDPEQRLVDQYNPLAFSIDSHNWAPVRTGILDSLTDLTPPYRQQIGTKEAQAYLFLKAQGQLSEGDLKDYSNYFSKLFHLGALTGRYISILIENGIESTAFSSTIAHAYAQRSPEERERYWPKLSRLWTQGRLTGEERTELVRLGAPAKLFPDQKIPVFPQSEPKRPESTSEKPRQSLNLLVKNYYERRRLAKILTDQIKLFPDKKVPASPLGEPSEQQKLISERRRESLNLLVKNYYERKRLAKILSDQTLRSQISQASEIAETVFPDQEERAVAAKKSLTPEQLQQAYETTNQFLHEHFPHWLEKDPESWWQKATQILNRGQRPKDLSLWRASQQWPAFLGEHFQAIRDGQELYQPNNRGINETLEFLRALQTIYISGQNSSLFDYLRNSFYIWAYPQTEDNTSPDPLIPDGPEREHWHQLLRYRVFDAYEGPRTPPRLELRPYLITAATTGLLLLSLLSLHESHEYFQSTVLGIHPNYLVTQTIVDTGNQVVDNIVQLAATSVGTLRSKVANLTPKDLEPAEKITLRVVNRSVDILVHTSKRIASLLGQPRATFTGSVLADGYRYDTFRIDDSKLQSILHQLPFTQKLLSQSPNTIVRYSAPKDGLVKETIIKYDPELANSVRTSFFTRRPDWEKLYFQDIGNNIFTVYRAEGDQTEQGFELTGLQKLGWYDQQKGLLMRPARTGNYLEIESTTSAKGPEAILLEKPQGEELPSYKDVYGLIIGRHSNMTSYPITKIATDGNGKTRQETNYASQTPAGVSVVARPIKVPELDTAGQTVAATYFVVGPEVVLTNGVIDPTTSLDDLDPMVNEELSALQTKYFALEEKDGLPQVVTVGENPSEQNSRREYIHKGPTLIAHFGDIVSGEDFQGVRPEPMGLTIRGVRELLYRVSTASADLSVRNLVRAGKIWTGKAPDALLLSDGTIAFHSGTAKPYYVCQKGQSVNVYVLLRDRIAQVPSDSEQYPFRVTLQKQNLEPIPLSIP